MLAATHYDNLFVLLFFGVAILFQLLSAAGKNRKRRDDQRKRSTSSPETSRPAEEEDDADRIRKFLEALGQPTTSKPPPVAQRPTYQKPIVVARKQPEPARRRSVLSPLPPLTTRPPDVPTQAERPRETRLPQPEPAASVTTPTEAYALATAAIEKVAQPKTDFAAMLRSTSGLRDAMILREIFGPPRSMQPLDLVGSV